MPRPTDVYGDELKPVALYSAGGRSLAPSTLVLVSALTVRDTAAHAYVADVAGYPRRMLAVVSTLDQAVNVLVGFNLDPGPGVLSPAACAGPFSVPAGQTRYLGPDGATAGGFISVPLLGAGNPAPGLWLELSCAVAPTTGSVSVYVLRAGL